VGGGLAGLTVARALENARWRVSVFERSLALHTPVVSGDIRVPDARAVLVFLEVDGKEIDELYAAAHNQDGDHLPQQKLLLLLARCLSPECLHLGWKVLRVGRAPGSACGLFCHLEDGVSTGPYDIVIGAQGQLLTYEPPAAPPVEALGGAPEDGLLAYVGDARWVRRRRWDLGMARRARGANMALCEGAELARRLRDGWPEGLAGVKRRLGHFDARPWPTVASALKLLLLLLREVLVLGLLLLACWAVRALGTLLRVALAVLPFAAVVWILCAIPEAAALPS